MRMTHVSLVSAKAEGGYAFLRPVPLLQISLSIVAVVVSVGHEHLNNDIVTKLLGLSIHFVDESIVITV